MSVRRTNRFWSVSLEHTLFLDFLKLFLNLRFVVSFAGEKKNAFFRPTDQKLWMLEVSRRSLGRAGMCCSQWERVDHLRKKRRAGRKKNSKKLGQPERSRRQSAASGRPLATGWRLDLFGCPNFFEIFLFKKMNFWKFGKWTRAFGRMGVQHPHFLKLANSSKIHGEWRFHFFP
jgi:hypothetical protein